MGEGTNHSPEIGSKVWNPELRLLSWDCQKNVSAVVMSDNSLCIQNKYGMKMYK